MKNKNKGFGLVGIVIVVVALLAVGGAYYAGTKKTSAPAQNLPENNLVGNDRDAHGCIGSAGYTWCEAKSKCLRSWEEKCEAIPAPTPMPTPVGSCTSATKPWVKVLSPKEGDVYTVGQKVNVKWEGCNLPPKSNVLFVIDGFESMNSPLRWYTTASSGSYLWTVPDMSGYNVAAYNLGFGVYYPGFVGANTKSGAFSIINSAPKTTDLNGRYVAPGCKIFAGCNRNYCVNINTPDMMTTCEYSPEYACYTKSFARCEKQVSGNCDWTNTSELKTCLDSNKGNNNLY